MNDDDYRMMVCRILDRNRDPQDVLAKFIYDEQCEFVGSGHEGECIRSRGSGSIPGEAGGERIRADRAFKRMDERTLIASPSSARP